MARRITVVLSQGQSHNPAKRKLEEDIVAALLFERGIEVTVIPNLYDLAPDGTGMLCLQGIAGDMIVLSWLFPRAARWILGRNDIRGQEGTSLIVEELDDDEDDGGDEADDDKDRVIDQLELPNRRIYCIDLRVRNDVAEYVDEVRRIADENITQVVQLDGWLGGDPKQEQLEQFRNPAPGNVHHDGNGNGQGRAGERPKQFDPPESIEPIVIQEDASRRWYPVIDFSRCTNCMECIDFCLFGVYGVDRVDTILVEQPDNCRKGCPACSRVCPENAIIFPQHKTPAIAGSAELAASLKIDLSKLFGAPDVDAVDVAVRERDEQLVIAGRDVVGHEIGLARRQSDKEKAPKDDLDDLIDQLDDFDV
jgi:hypothetical protein